MDERGLTIYDRGFNVTDPENVEPNQSKIQAWNTCDKYVLAEICWEPCGCSHTDFGIYCTMYYFSHLLFLHLFYEYKFRRNCFPFENIECSLKQGWLTTTAGGLAYFYFAA